MALRYGAQSDWWIYQSENEPGHTDNNGTTYDTTTYSLLLAEGGNDLVLTIRAEYVPGWVLATAFERGGLAAYEHVKQQFGWP